MDLANENIVTTFKCSGLTQEAFCKQHNVAIEKLRYYLYKKNKVTTSAECRKRSKVSPSFISFNRPDFAESPSSGRIHTFTIIQGQLTLPELVELVSEMGTSRC